ncbi:protein MpDIR57 [Marchantia polymorpha subsp. ruderalis]|uniref:Uncharacterized protein n=2 Tax=Marchantia polymorpha TaxID=3197 RepID=A0AAF6BKA1_MARPO|nr:hypothetical protein MARPO_0190s0001 [Marchantia polymorpha]BBN12435.1 hypothetical protein Mp_5g20050 [Marchantia polymorpha subsp. ruderalis]|eukprot:PTQ27602.1 hypothetical protein MARPO_0190s0001 [Marchantia polymorpha]
MDHMPLRSNSKVNTSYCKYVMNYYEFIPAGDTEVFKPLAADPVPNKGIGYIKNNLLYSQGTKKSLRAYWWVVLLKNRGRDRECGDNYFL